MLLLRQYLTEETHMDILLMVHSWIRWLILLVAILSVLEFIVGSLLRRLIRISILPGGLSK